MSDSNAYDSVELLKPWLLVHELTIFQAVMLALGKAPTHEHVKRPPGYPPLMQAFKQGVQCGQIRLTPPIGMRSHNVRPSGPVALSQLVNKLVVRQWLHDNGVTDAFFFLSSPDEWPMSNGTAAKVQDEAETFSRGGGIGDGNSQAVVNGKDDQSQQTGDAMTISLDALPVELRVAINAYQTIENNPSLVTGRSPKAAILKWLSDNHPSLSGKAKDRIATVANPAPEGGAPKTPDKT